MPSKKDNLVGAVKGTDNFFSDDSVTKLAKMSQPVQLPPKSSMNILKR